jgi:hypothetical protein
VLVPRVRSFLTDDENVKLDGILWHVAHPHPLGIDRPDSGARNACDTPFERGELAMVLERDDSTDGAWCDACIAIVVEAMKAARAM